MCGLFFGELPNVSSKERGGSHFSVAQNQTGGVTQVLAHVSTDQGSILV